MNSSTSKDICHQILDAAEETIAREGVAKLTIEAVARHAGLSKSGLLHHFHCKDSLIDALVDRTVDQWRQSLDEAIALQPVGPQRTARGLLHCCLGDVSLWNERCRRSSTALLAVLVHCPGKSTALHQFYQTIHAEMQREAAGVPTGDLVLAVIDGIWLRWVTGLAPLEEYQLIAIRDQLQQLLAPQRTKTTRKSPTR